MTKVCEECLNKQAEISELKKKLSNSQQKLKGLERLMLSKDFLDWLRSRRMKRSHEASKKISASLLERNRLLREKREIRNAKARERAAIKRAESKKLSQDSSTDQQ
jgi:hypothetical protein